MVRSEALMNTGVKKAVFWDVGAYADDGCSKFL
jgi:hypothetical protein